MTTLIVLANTKGVGGLRKLKTQTVELAISMPRIPNGVIN